MYIVEPRHEWQVTHDTRIAAAFLGTHFPSAATATAAQPDLITPLDVSNKVRVVICGALEIPSCTPKYPDAVYHIGGKKFRRGWGMGCAKRFGPFPVVIRRFIEQAH